MNAVARRIIGLAVVVVVLSMGGACGNTSTLRYVPAEPELSDDAVCTMPLGIDTSIWPWVDASGRTLDTIGSSILSKGEHDLRNICGLEHGESFTVEQALIHEADEAGGGDRYYVCTGTITRQGNPYTREEDTLTISLEGPSEGCAWFSGVYTHADVEEASAAEAEPDAPRTACQVWVECVCAIDAAMASRPAGTAPLDFSEECREGKELLRTQPEDPACDAGLIMIRGMAADLEKLGVALPNACHEADSGQR